MTEAAQPLANLLAFGSKDPSRLESFERRVRSSDRYPEVWRAHSQWLFASRPLPRSIPDATLVHAEGFAFAQGRTALLDGFTNPQETLRRFARDLREEPESLARWPGDFACFYVDPGGTLHATRACSGLIPLYWWSDCGNTVVSTEINALIQFGGWHGELDPMPAALASSGWLNSFGNLTHLKGVQQLQPGETLAIRPGGNSRPRSYWMPLPERVATFSPEAEREHQHELRSLLLKSLKQDLNPAGNNLLSLSGGVDSSSLLALAAGVLGVPVMTFSLVPPVSAATHTRELGFVRGIRERMGVHDCWERDLTVDTLENLFNAAPQLPRPVIHPVLCALPEVLRTQNIDVMFGGEFADEVCGSSFTLSDWCAATPFTELLTSFRRWPKGWTSLPRWFKVKAKYLLGRPYLMLPERLPEWCAPQLNAQFQENRRRQIEWVNTLPVIHRNMFTNHMTIDFAPMNWEVCSHFNIRRCIPFLTRQAIELTARCHPAELVGPGTKRLLRGALLNDVPHENLFRVDKGNFGYGLDDIDRDPSMLDLANDSIWGPLEPIVSPAWRASTLKKGSLKSGDSTCLLALKVLSANVRKGQLSAVKDD